MKKTIIFTLIFTFILLESFSISSYAAYYNTHLEKIKSEAYLLVNTDTDTIVFAQNEREQLKCASLVKTATAILTAEKCENLDEVITVSETALKPLEGIYSSSCKLQAGEKISVRDLLYCVMLENANDASNVLAEHIGGSIEEFVSMMNEFAKSIGCTDTNFTNPHGLDEEGEYTTAYDMYLLTKYAMKNSVLSVMSETVNYTVPATNMSEERKLNNRCDVVEIGTRYYYEYAKGFKTGQTDEAQRCAAVSATKDAYSYIAIVLGCPNECVDKCGYSDNTALYEARTMLQWAFKNLTMTIVAEKTDIIASVNVALSSKTDHVGLVPEKQLQALLLNTVNESSLEFIYETTDNVKAPVKKGDILGTVKIKYADNVIASVNLVANEDVERSFILYSAEIIKGVVSSPIFILCAIAVILGISIYIAVIYSKYKKKQHQTRKRLREIKESNLAADSNYDEVLKK